MKALLLAGGTGSRLRPLSHSRPKQLVPVANRPVLFHALDTIREAGITDVGMIVSAPGTRIREAVGDGDQFGVTITYLPQRRPEGLAHCVLIARDFLGADDFLMYLGDNIFIGGIAEPMAEFERTRPAAQLLVTKVADPSSYGIAEVDESGRVTALQEKPANPASDLAVTGAYFFGPEIHQAVDSIARGARGEYEITDSIAWLVDQGREVLARPVGGYWKDTGTLTDLLECNKVMLEATRPAVAGSVDASSVVSGAVVLGPGSTVCRSVLSGPMVIGAGCTIVDSYVGPFTAIGDNCHLSEAGLEYSILLDNASVHGARNIQASIVGEAGQVRPARPGSRSNRLMVGDHSRIELP